MGKKSKRSKQKKQEKVPEEKLSTETVSTPITLEKPDQPPTHFDPNDKLTPEEIAACSDRVEQALEIENNKELNLMKSDVTVPGQEWCLISFIGKGCKQETKELGMKIWGCFDDIKAAKKHADQLNKIEENKIFDIFILEMYTWARIPPDPECIDDQNYHEEKLHELITDHKRQQLRAKEVFDLRKEKLTKNPDMNQFNRNKQVLKDLMKENTITEDTEGEQEGEEDKPKIQNEDALKEIHGEPLKLPTLEILEEPDERFTEEKSTEEQITGEKTKDEPSETLNDLASDSNPFNQKFYND